MNNESNYIILVKSLDESQAHLLTMALAEMSEVIAKQDRVTALSKCLEMKTAASLRSLEVM